MTNRQDATETLLSLVTPNREERHSDASRYSVHVACHSAESQGFEAWQGEHFVIDEHGNAVAVTHSIRGARGSRVARMEHVAWCKCGKTHKCFVSADAWAELADKSAHWNCCAGSVVGCVIPAPLGSATAMKPEPSEPVTSSGKWGTRTRPVVMAGMASDGDRVQKFPCLFGKCSGHSSRNWGTADGGKILVYGWSVLARDGGPWTITQTVSLPLTGAEAATVPANEWTPDTSPIVIPCHVRFFCITCEATASLALEVSADGIVSAASDNAYRGGKEARRNASTQFANGVFLIGMGGLMAARKAALGEMLSGAWAEMASEPVLSVSLGSGNAAPAHGHFHASPNLFGNAANYGPADGPHTPRLLPMVDMAKLRSGGYLLRVINSRGKRKGMAPAPVRRTPAQSSMAALVARDANVANVIGAQVKVSQPARSMAAKKAAASRKANGTGRKAKTSGKGQAVTDRSAVLAKLAAAGL